MRDDRTSSDSTMDVVFFLFVEFRKIFRRDVKLNYRVAVEANETSMNISLCRAQNY